MNISSAPPEHETPGADALALWKTTTRRPWPCWSVIARMPDEWQARLAALLNELDDAIPASHLPAARHYDTRNSHQP